MTVKFNPFDEISERLSRIENSLIELYHENKQNKTASSPDILLTVDNLIAELPDLPARQTVYGWVNNSKIPYEKHGNKLYFRKSLIDEWLDNGRQMNHLK